MPSTPSLLTRIKAAYPQFTFTHEATFHWAPDTHTISIDTASPDCNIFLLHELGHALLGHNQYIHDLDLLRMERDAWNYAVLQLADTYEVIIPEDDIQNNLDTYREWLHARSTCPSCQTTGLQLGSRLYSCLACGCRWKSNDARNCALRRYKMH